MHLINVQIHQLALQLIQKVVQLHNLIQIMMVFLMIKISVQIPLITKMQMMMDVLFLKGIQMEME